MEASTIIIIVQWEQTDYAYNVSAPGSVYAYSTNSELAYMYYNNLGNLGYYNTQGDRQAGWGPVNTGPFINLQDARYFSGNIYENRSRTNS